MTKTTELKVLIEFLRSEGITSYEENGIRLTLLPQKPEALEASKSEAKPARRDKIYHKTEQEQVDLFGEVISPVE